MSTSFRIVSICAAVIALVAAAVWLGSRERASSSEVVVEHPSAAQRESSSARVRPSPRSQALGHGDSPRMRLCGRVSPYEPIRGPGRITVSVARPGTTHPIQTTMIDADGRWSLDSVPDTPLTLAVTVPGSPALAHHLASPEPCSREVYELALSSGPATILRGTTHDVYGGAIAGAEIDVIPHGPGGRGFEQPVFRTISHESGEFELELPADDYVVHARSPGYSQATAGADTTLRTIATLTLTLSPGATISGRVLRASDGEGVANAELRLVALSDAGGSEINHASRADAVSGPHGVFVIDNVGVGSWALYARAEQGISAAPTEIAVNLYDDLREVIVTVDAGTPVHGQVHERGTDSPIADAQVLLQSETWTSPCSASDDQGLFECGMIPRGTYTAIVSHSGYAGTLLGASVQVGAEPRSIELELERGHTIVGQVSPPVAGVAIRVRMDAADLDLRSLGYGMMNAFRSARTDAEGRFEIGPLALGELTLIAEHLEHGRGQERIDQARAEAGDELEIRLDTAGSLRGRVTELGATQGSSLTVMLTPIDEPQRIDGTRQPGAAMYTIAVDEAGSFHARGLEPGRYAVQLRHSSGRVDFDGPTQVELVELQPAEITLALAAAQRRFVGVVVDEQGAAVEGAVVELAEQRSTRTLSDLRGEFTLLAWSEADAVAARYHRAGHSTAASDATLRVGERNRLVVPSASNLVVVHPGVDSGRLILTGETRIDRPLGGAARTTLRNLLAGHYRVHVCGDAGYGAGEITLGQREATLTVDTRPWVELRGTAIGPDGAALIGAQVFALPTDDPCGVFRRAAMAAFTDGMVLTDDHGSFTLAGLPPGPTMLVFVDSSDELTITVEIPPGHEHHDLGPLRLPSS